MFAGVPAEPLRSFAWKTRLLTYKKKGIVFNEGDPADGGWWMVDGCVKIAKTAPTGRSVTLELLTKGEGFGPAVVFDSSKLHLVSALAVTKASAVKAAASDVTALMKAWPPFAQAVLVQVGRRLNHAYRLRALNAESAGKKVAATLLWLREEIGSPFAISRREIADIAGVAPETAIRVVLAFKRRRWITVDAGRISLRKPDRLQNYIEQS